MNPPKYTAIEYINFLIATQKAYSFSEASMMQPGTKTPLAHNTITRLQHRLEPKPEALWQEAKKLVNSRQSKLDAVHYRN